MPRRKEGIEDRLVKVQLEYGRLSEPGVEVIRKLLFEHGVVYRRESVVIGVVSDLVVVSCGYVLNWKGERLERRIDLFRHDFGRESELLWTSYRIFLCDLVGVEYHEGGADANALEGVESERSESKRSDRKIGITVGDLISGPEFP